MEVLYPRCCGLDVHKSSITARVLLAQTGKPLKHIRRFGCTTREIRDLVAWLREFAVEHVAMESTGVYWKPPKARNLSRQGLAFRSKYLTRRGLARPCLRAQS